MSKASKDSTASRNWPSWKWRWAFVPRSILSPKALYTVPAELREWLTSHGFEVGVHDLNHDGHLFSSRESFQHKARRINSYLEEWDAVGFRSGFMLRNLEWIHDLNIAYDASTFDTDPFEPQPDGVNTIFPFWVPRRSEVRAQQGQRPNLSTLNPQLSTSRAAATWSFPTRSLKIPRCSFCCEKGHNRIWKTKARLDR